MNFKDALILETASAVLQLGAFIVHIIGYAAPYWINNGYYHAGLWKTCLGDQCSDITVKLSCKYCPLLEMFHWKYNSGI